MDVPDLVRTALQGEDVEAGVTLGDDDAVYVTPTRTLVYRGEGLLSDESVSEYPHGFERLAVSEGRRKTKFTITYVDREEAFSVPGQRTESVLEQLLQGTLREDGVLGDTESVLGVYRFSELTLIVCQQRVLKHVGNYTWDADFEVYPFADVTGLDFEEGSVATAVVLEVDGRPERIKAPNEQAALLRRTVESALFEYYDVDSLEALHREIGVEGSPSDGAEDSGGLNLEAGIDPLTGGSSGSDGEDVEQGDPTQPDSAGKAGVSNGDADPTASAGGDGTPSGTEALAEGDVAAGTETPSDAATATDERGADADGRRAAERASGSDGSAGESDGSTTESDGPGTASNGPATASDVRTSEDLAAVEKRLDALTEAVERQNETLERQQRVIKQLIEELRKTR